MGGCCARPDPAPPPFKLSFDPCASLPASPPRCPFSDVWAAGCILYELCALQRPFRGASVSAVVVRVLRGEYAPLDSARYRCV